MCIFAFIIMGTVREMCCTETDKGGKGKPKDGDNFKRGGKKRWGVAEGDYYPRYLFLIVK